jgi:hypothetical protein
MTKFLFQIIILITTFLVACDPIDSRLTIINETNRPLFYITTAQDSIEGGTPFKKFIEASNIDSVWIDSDYFIKPKGKKRKMVMSDWEEIIRNNFNGKIYIFFFDADTLQKYNWVEIKKNNNYFAKYGLTLIDLKKRDWKVRVK